jgi:hypothetical protein
MLAFRTIFPTRPFPPKEGDLPQRHNRFMIPKEDGKEFLEHTLPFEEETFFAGFFPDGWKQEQACTYCAWRF